MFKKILIIVFFLIAGLLGYLYLEDRAAETAQRAK